MRNIDRCNDAQTNGRVGFIKSKRSKHLLERSLRRVVVACTLASVCVAANVSAGTPASGHTPVRSAKHLCEQVGRALKRERDPSGPKSLFVESVDMGGRSWRYQGVDLDADGKADEVLQGCGSSSDGTCTLDVKLSTGGAYEFSEETFKVIRFRTRHYVVVGDSSPASHVGARRLYALTGHGANLICKSF